MPYTGELELRIHGKTRVYPAKLLYPAQWVVWQGLWADPKPKAMVMMEYVGNLPNWSKKWLALKGPPQAADRIRRTWIHMNSALLNGLRAQGVDMGDPGPRPRGKGSIRKMWKAGVPEVFGI